MQRAEYMQALENNYKTGLKIMEAKNKDYAGDVDPFANFRLCEGLGISGKKGILVRMTDKMSRVSNLLDAQAQVKDESIQDTLLDLANYANILLVWIDSESPKEKVAVPRPGEWKELRNRATGELVYPDDIIDTR